MKWWSKAKEAVEDFYYSTVPYNWRPGQVWYRLQCWVWHRYTTVRPRSLPWHTWTDRSVLLPHCMFEILGKFIEEECSPGCIDWEATKRYKHVRKEMQELWDWWNQVYLKWEKREDEIFKGIEQGKIVDHEDQSGVTPGTTRIDIRCSTPEATRKWVDACMRSSKEETELNEELKRNCHRLIEIMDYMWT